jgi:hypothetical protein
VVVEPVLLAQMLLLRREWVGLVCSHLFLALIFTMQVAVEVALILEQAR